MTATSLTPVKPLPAQRGPRGAGLCEPASFNGDPAFGNQATKPKKEPANERNRGVLRRTYEHATRKSEHLNSSAEHNDLAARIKAGDQAAREALIMANLGLVANIAKRYYSYGASLDDLIQEGNCGLIHAVERYDPERHNTRFSTYATYWIRNKIQRAVAANFSLVRLPEYLFRLNVLAHHVDGESQIENGVAPAVRGSAALGSHLRISRRQRQLLKHAKISRVSYYGVDDYGGETNLPETLPDTCNPERDLETAEELDQLHKAIEQLTPVEGWLIRHRFGLEDPHENPRTAIPIEGAAANAATGSREWTYRRMARTLGIPQRRIREVEQIALQKLRISLQRRVPSRRRSTCGVTESA